jgi:hypothetical protein
MTERCAQLAKFPFPQLDAAFLAGAMRALMAMLVVGALLCLANGLVRRWSVTNPEVEARH